MYTALVLDEISKNNLLKLTNSLNIQLDNWAVIAHHMTVNLNKLDKNLNKLAKLGSVHNIEVHSWGISDKAFAVAVETDLNTINATPHITIAISPTGKPKDSNAIIRWTEFAVPIIIQGTLLEVL